MLGNPSFKEHLHGIGSTVYTYFPQGLCFSTMKNNTNATLYPSYFNKPLPDFIEYEKLYYFNQNLSYNDYKTMLNNMYSYFASKHVKQIAETKSVLAGGRKSPDGNLVATTLAKGGYWDNWIIIDRPGKAELREQADYFISDFKWVDNKSLLYVDGMGKFTLINTETGTQKEVYAWPAFFNGQFDITLDRKVKFIDNKGKTQEFKIPDFL